MQYVYRGPYIPSIPCCFPIVEKSLQGNPKAKASTGDSVEKSSSLISAQITLSVLWGGANIGCVCGACVRVIICHPCVFNTAKLRVRSSCS